MTAVSMRYAAISAPGIGKRRNEDAVMLGGPIRQGTFVVDGIFDPAIPSLFAVADGLSVSVDPHRASTTVLKLLRTVAAGEPPADLAYVFRLVQDQFAACGLKECDADMASTLVAARVKGTEVSVCNAGDSRAYVRRADGSIEPLSRDHTQIQEMIDEGEIDAIDAYDAASMYSALTSHFLSQPGYNELEVHSASAVLAPGDMLILASDGLQEVLDDALIGSLLDRCEGACLSTLLNIVRSRGGTDDFSVLCIAR